MTKRVFGNSKFLSFKTLHKKIYDDFCKRFRIFKNSFYHLFSAILKVLCVGTKILPTHFSYAILGFLQNLKNKFQTAEAEEIKEMKEKLENIVKPIIGKMYENEEAGGGDAEEDDEHDEL